MELAYPSWAPARDPMCYLEFSQTLMIPDGPYRGDPYDPLTEAAQKIVCDVLDGKILDFDGEPFRDIVLVWPTQAGKSLCGILVPTLHTTIEHAESCIYCLPTLDLLNKVWIDKLKPSIEGAGFAKWIPEKGPGSRGGRPTSLQLRDPDTGDRVGSVIFIAGGTGNRKEVGQAGVTGKTVLIDEADEYTDVHRVALVRQRAAAFGSDAITITVSTVKKDQNSVILALAKDGTETDIYYACPYCDQYQTIEWEQVEYTGDNDVDVARSAAYKCKHCEVLLSEKDRRIMLSKYTYAHKGQTINEKGERVGPTPKTKTFSLVCEKLEFGIGLGLQELATEHRKAQRMLEQTRDHGLMRSFYRDRLSREYTAERDELPESLTNKYLALKSARANWSKRSVPDWAEQLYAAVDVQHDRVYWVVIAVTRGLRWAPVDWGYEYGDNEQKQTATKELRHQQLDIVRDTVMAGWGIVGSEETLTPTLGAVDAGYATDEVTEWIHNQGRGWVAIRGYGEGEDEKGSKVGKKREDLQGWGELRLVEERRETWLFCNSQAVVRWMHDSLMRKTGTDGSGEIPKDSSGEPLKSSNALLLHITQNVYDYDQAKGKWYWRKVHAGRRDWRDTIKYALTLAKFKINQDAKRTKNTKSKGKRSKGIRKVGKVNAGRNR